ncbi:hypothetical protein BGZ80_008042, partial [Entomortierella chlamydospora]
TKIGGSLGKSNPAGYPLASQKQKRRQSESNKFEKRTSDSDFQDTAAALEDLEKEIGALKSKEIALPTGDDILLVSDTSSPTQYYDSEQTRYALRAFLLGGNREFEEMIEYGFPSDLFPDSDSKSRTATASDPLPEMNCHYLTLRITLTPWHARADESKLYGPVTDATENQTQLKTMVNKFFTRTPGAATGSSSGTSTPVSMSSPPPSQRARMLGGSRRPSEQSVTTRSNRSSAEHTTSTESARATPISHPDSERETVDLSRTSIRSDDRSPERYGSGRARSRTDASAYPISTKPTTRFPAAAGNNSGRSALLPPSSMRTQSPLPRKGSLSVLSVPIKYSQELRPQTFHDRGLMGNNGTVIPPFRRDGSSPAIFSNPPS